jgi:hypothetical protein
MRAAPQIALLFARRRRRRVVFHSRSIARHGKKANNVAMKIQEYLLMPDEDLPAFGAKVIVTVLVVQLGL